MEVLNPTGLVALLGNPVGHSLSPKIHNAAFKETGINWCYHAFNVDKESLPLATAGLKALNFKGGNVTSPFKEEVIAHLDEITDKARTIGAVNTLILKDTILKGDNTDGEGYMTYIEQDEQFYVQNKRVLVLGAGGAAKSICIELLKRSPTKITVANRNVQRGMNFIGHLREHLFNENSDRVRTDLNSISLSRDELIPACQHSHLLINTTPVDPPSDLLQHIIDGKTELKFLSDLRYGKAIGDYLFKINQRSNVRTGDGLRMLLHQGAHSFEKWTGEQAPLKTMEQILMG